MATLLDYSFAGADADPDPTFTTPSGRGTFRRVSNKGAVSTNNTFSVAYDGSHSATANQKSTIYMSDVGGRNGGPAVCIDPSTGACYFIQNGNAADISVYWFNGGAFTVIGTILGVAYNTTDSFTLERVGTTLKVRVNGTQVGSDITDTNLSGGQPGTTGYDDAQRWSRVVFEDDSAGPTGGGGPLFGGPTRSPLTQGRLTS